MAEQETKQIYAATGRRKEATARIRLMPGNGDMTINGKEVGDYLTRETLVKHAQEPLEIVELLGTVDIVATCRGGGLSGQAGAVRLAISRAVAEYQPDTRVKLRQGGFLTRDPREVERKKYGQPKARKRFQYSKR
jgi:small subunit ribosomal protein S9